MRANACSKSANINTNNYQVPSNLFHLFRIVILTLFHFFQVESLYLDSKSAPSNPGRIEIALHYLSKHEKLVVDIIRCVGLKALDPNGFSDPYVKW